MQNLSVFISNDDLPAFLASCRELEVPFGETQPDDTCAGYSWVTLEQASPSTLVTLGQMTMLIRQKPVPMFQPEKPWSSAS